MLAVVLAEAAVAAAEVVKVVVSAAEIHKNLSWEPLGGDARVRAQYDAHLPSLYLWYRENLWTLLTGTVLPTLHSHIICKNWHLYGVCWEDCECKNSHVVTPPGVATTIAGLLKVAWGVWHGCLQPSGGRPSYPQKTQTRLGLTFKGKFS